MAKKTAPKAQNASVTKVKVKHEESIVRDVPVTVKEENEQYVPSVKGKTLAGKELCSARWQGKALVVTDVHNVSYTLTDKELEDFLA